MTIPLHRRQIVLAAPALLLGCGAEPIAPGSVQQFGMATADASAWPLGQAEMQPGPTRSSNVVSLPADLPITPAGPDVPEMLRNAPGQWRGYGGAHREFSVAVAIQSVTESGGRGAFDAASSVHAAHRLGWTFAVMHRNELKGPLSNNFATLTMRPRPDGHMDVMFESARIRFSGVVSRLG